jgi:hypothetical protein
MTDKQQYNDTEVLRAKLNAETAVVKWTEMEKFFARGDVLKVESSLSLLDVAMAMSLDKKEDISAWLEAGSLLRASDDDARDWQARKPLFWCVVTAPWVLLQEKPGTSKGENIH